MRAPLRSTGIGIGFAAAGALLAITHAGCISQPEDASGVVRVAVTMVPADVGCIRLTAAGTRTVSQQFDVTPGASSILLMSGVPTGSVTFSGAAFTGLCSMVGDLTTANWVADPVTAQVTSGVIVDVMLVMHRNGRARIGVDFQDDPTTPPPTCTDGIKNGAETDVDCGGGMGPNGPCGPCAIGRQCAVNRDCFSFVCTGGVCAASSCTDGARNGAETDVDCGGPTGCPRCGAGQGCASPADCANGMCGFDMRCVTPAATCSDGIRNGTESDVDCGGPVMGGSNCNLCADGRHCNVSRDCASALCVAGICAVPTCADGVTNGGESGVDCGGPTCPRCAAGQPCHNALDCASGVCDLLTMQCVGAPSCTDGVANGNETGVDCGGPCPQCANGQPCRVDSDCAGGFCSSGTCADAFSCTDGLQNGAETDVDCGGGSCGGCPFGGNCRVNTDCFSLVCDPRFRRCRGSCTDGIQDGNEPDVDCGFTCQVGCVAGQHCVTNNDCAGNLCVGGICEVTTCTDGVRSGIETDVDCGGRICRACVAGQRCRVATDCVNGQCSFQGTCTANDTGCTIDGIFSGDETDLDCGGSCPACDIGQHCLVDGDCFKSVCLGGVCSQAPPTCTDHVLNQDETGVDCGGTICGACPGDRCRDGKECASRACVAGACGPMSCNDGIQDDTETDVDCGGGACNDCLLGQHCLASTDCLKSSCVGGICSAPTCTDGVQNGTETDVDCGGLTCGPCLPGSNCQTNSDCLSNFCLSSFCF